jgi:phosphopantothenoylcysteine decarboxylase/phosphopantothenate--cysteine ligase
MSLRGTKTILAITGGIAAFKALGVLRLLKHHGAEVYVVMTEHATHFLAPASCELVSGHPVSVDLFAPLKTWEMEHIALAHGAELVLVVPATANLIAKLALGIADDLLSTLLVVLAA